MQTATLQKKEQNDSSALKSVSGNNSDVEHENETGAEAGVPVFLQCVASLSTSPPPPIQRQNLEEEEELIQTNSKVSSIQRQHVEKDEEDPLQPKLIIGQPGDKYEQEADQVANTVMRMPPSGQSDTVQPTPVSPFYIQSFNKDNQEEDSQAMALPEIQGKFNSGSPLSSSHHLAKTIHSPGGGTLLPKHLQSRVGKVLGSDLSHVRVHNDSTANEAAQSIHAKAFTHKHHIFLNDGESVNDKKLIAHELTHVVQQESNNSAIKRIPMDPPLSWGQHTASSATVSDPIENMSHEERLSEIRSILNNWWVGLLNEARLERLWGSFGETLPVIMSSNESLWTQSVERGASLENIPYVRRLISNHFKSDVKTLARHYLRVNEEEIRIEMDQIAAEGDVSGRPIVYLSPIDQDVREQIEYIQRMGELARDAFAAERALRSIKLGTKTTYGSGDYGFPQTSTWNVRFDPHGPPRCGHIFGLGSTTYSPLADAPSWEEVKEQWDAVKTSQAQLYTDYPSVAALVQEESLESFLAGNTESARERLAESMVSVLMNIQRSRTALDTDDLDFRDLKPIHQQLLSGTENNSGINWSDPLPNWALTTEMANHETREFWIELGLGSLAAAAFIVAEIATFGGATFFIALGAGLAIGGGLAASKWENYEDLSTANQANVLPDTRLVSDAGLRAALIDATLESVFFFLDALGPAIRGIRVARTASMSTETTGEVLEAQGRIAGREAEEEVVGRATREAGEETEINAVRDASARAGQGIFTSLDEALVWARDAFALTADILNNLSLAAINRLRSLSTELIQQFRSLSTTLKRLALGCASACRCDIVALRRFLEDRAALTTVNRTPINTVDELIDALPSCMNTTLIRDKLERQPFLMTMIREAGITVDDLSAIAIERGIVTGGGNTAVAAKENFSRFLTSLIPAKVGSDRDRFLTIITAMREAEGGRGSVTSAFQGPMFENYSRLYVRGFQNKNFSRITYDSNIIPGLTHTRTSDGFVPGRRELWDFKLSDNIVDAQQANDYRRILNFESTRGRPRVTSINYLFPTLEAARTNQHLLRTPGFNVYYLSPTGRRMRLRNRSR